MVQLNILSGKLAGTSRVTRHFPVRIGRAAGSELQLEEPGVWDQHLTIQPESGSGFVLRTEAQALARVNGQPVEQSVLRNGDLIEMGSVTLQFWVAPARQSRLRWDEMLTWAAIASVTVGQVALLYWLLR